MLLPFLLLAPDLGGPPLPRALKQLVAPESPGEARLREAKALRYAQRFFEAAALYRAYLQDFPRSGRSAEARFWLAATLEQDQRWEEAIAAYTDFLTRHPEERLLGKEAKMNRVRCWGIRQYDSPGAMPGLLAALADETPEVSVAAALQLAKRSDRRAVDALQRGLSMPAFADACSMALVQMGLKPNAAANPGARFLVIRIQPQEKPDAVTIRLALGLARALESYLSDEQIRQARSKGVELGNLSEQAMKLPKGSLLLEVQDAKSRIAVTVE